MKYLQTIRRTEDLLDSPFRMRHHPRHISFPIADSGDIIQRTIWVALLRDIAAGIAISEKYLIMLFQFLNIRLKIIVVSIFVRNWDFQYVAGSTAARVWIINLLRPQIDEFA